MRALQSNLNSRVAGRGWVAVGDETGMVWNRQYSTPSEALSGENREERTLGHRRESVDPKCVSLFNVINNWRINRNARRNVGMDPGRLEPMP